MKNQKDTIWYFYPDAFTFPNQCTRKNRNISLFGHLHVRAVKALFLFLLFFASANVCFAQTIRYVKPVASGNGSGSSWANASGDLQAMINASASGNQIWVAGGTYKPNRQANATGTITANNRNNAFVLKSGVNMYGNFAGTETALSQRNITNTAYASILSGDFNGNDLTTGDFSNHSENAYHVVIAANSGSVPTADLNGFTITGGSANGSSATTITVNSQAIPLSNGGGIYCVSFQPNLRYLKIINNRATNGGGMYAATMPFCYYLSIRGNFATAGGGVYTLSNAQPLVNSLIAGNVATSGGGVYISNSETTFINCTIASNYASSSGRAIGGANVTGVNFYNSIVYNNGSATINGFSFANTLVTAFNSITQTLAGQSIVANPEFTNLPAVASTSTASATAGDYTLKPVSPAINIGNNIYPNNFGLAGDLNNNNRTFNATVDLGAYEYQANPFPSYTANIGAGGILYVRKGATGTGSNWSDALGELAYALKEAKTKNAQVAGTVKEIWVAGGTYKPLFRSYNLMGNNPAERENAFVLVKDVKVYGGFSGSESSLSQRDLTNTSNASVLSGDYNGNDLTTAFTNHTENTYHVIISAGDVGTAVLDGFTLTGGCGYVSNAYDDNKVNTYVISKINGGSINNTNSSPSYNNIVCTNNYVTSYGGGVYNESSAPIFNFCHIVSNNSFEGGGVYNIASSPVFTNVKIAGNSSSNNGAAFANYSSTVVATNVVITGNKANNAAGGIYNTSASTSTFTNATIAGNNDVFGASAFYNDNSTSYLKIYNSIIWGNRNTTNSIGANFSSSYSITQITGSSYPGNVNTDPLFANPIVYTSAPTTTGDYTFQSSSPALNSGSNHFYASGASPDLSSVTTDAAGKNRFIGSSVDKGAYELQSTCIQPSANGIIPITPVPMCAGDTAILSVSFPDLGDAAEWKWYTGSCGGTPVGTGVNISVTPATTTTYYARGEGGCVGQTATCVIYTLDVTPSASFTVDLTASPSGNINYGTNVDFFANAMSPHVSNQEYTWKKNGSIIQSGSSAGYSSASLVNGDTIIVTVSAMANQGYCLSQNNISDTLVMSVTMPVVYYSKDTGILQNLTSWGVNPDGSGSNPASFATGTFNLANRSQFVLSDWNNQWIVDGTIHIPAGSQLFLNDAILKAAKITGTGTIASNSSNDNTNLVITGTDSSQLYFATGANNLFSFQVTTGKVSIGSPLSITGVLIVGQAATLYTNDQLTLKSLPDAYSSGSTYAGENTAMLSPVFNAQGVGQPIGTIIGKATVERNIPAGKRAWRLLSVPVNTTQTIRDAWQEGGSAITGFGTLITSNTYNSTNGFDMASNSSSILSHNQGGMAGPGWNPVSNTNATILNNPGYMLFIRGDRTATPANTIAPGTTMRVTGTLRTGTQPAVPVSATGSGYTLVGNPYAAPVSFDAIANTPNLNPEYYIWDSRLAGTYGVGGFRLIERLTNGSYETTPALANPQGDLGVINSGQAVFLKASGATANVVFTEGALKWGEGLNVLRGNSSESQLKINLLVPDVNNNMSVADGVRIRYNSAYSAAVTTEDVVKMNNFAENLASRRENKILIVEKRPLVTANDTIFLNLSNTSVKSYRFIIKAENLAANITAFLVDNYLGSETQLNLDSSTVNFDVTTVAGSAAANRFMIVFKPMGPLPVTITAVKAYQHNTNIMVEWNVANEQNIREYEVEKSGDGRSFVKMGAVDANGSTGYHLADVNPVQGNNFYRIKSIGAGGETKYTQIVKVTLGKSGKGFQVYPNPVAQNMINLSFVNQPKGVYTVRLLNYLSQVITSRQITHNNGSSTEAIYISSMLAKGNYLLEITAPDNKKEVIQIIY